MYTHQASAVLAAPWSGSAARGRGRGRLAGGGGGERLAVGALVAGSAAAAVCEALLARVRFHAPPAVLTSAWVVRAEPRIWEEIESTVLSLLLSQRYSGL